jgi:DNA-binding transcriptional ArsR family regulator
LDLLTRPIAAICKSLADENRLRILLAIGHDKKSVSQIAESTRLSQPLVSHHLKELRRCHLLTVERQGPFVYYQVSNGAVLLLLARMDEMARELIKAHEPF